MHSKVQGSSLSQLGRMLGALLLVTALTQQAWASRIVSIIITKDGKTWFSGKQVDNGNVPPAYVWQYLSTCELKPANGVTLEVDSKDPMQLTLKGNIVIDVRYGGKAEVKELQLVRRSDTSGWTMRSIDVNRIAKEIGLDKLPADFPRTNQSDNSKTTSEDANGPPYFYWAIASGLAVSVAVLGIFIRLKQKRS